MSSSIRLTHPGGLSCASQPDSFETDYGSGRSTLCKAGDGDIELGGNIATSATPLKSRCRFLGSSETAGLTTIGAPEARNLLLLALSYTCVASSTTLIVGGSAVVVISVGGGSDVAPIALSSFFGGSSLISLATNHIFNRLGRKGGFVVGSVLGILGGAIGAAAVALSSPALVVLSAFPVGLRQWDRTTPAFAAMEVVGDSKSLAMTLTLSGGCLAAFLGPETQALTRYTFGKDMEYFGLFIMIIAFNAVGSMLISRVHFSVGEVSVHGLQCSEELSEDTHAEDTTSAVHERRNSSTENDPEEHQHNGSMLSLTQRFDFFSSAALACLSWSIMAMPMSIVRVAMNEVGYSARISLTTLELHFLGMFAPGFITGALIQRIGLAPMRFVGLALFVAALVSNLLSRPEGDGGTVGTWMTGLTLLGVGWNLVFSCSTVMLSETYAKEPANATKIQSTNDFFMFGVSGALVVSTGFIFQAGGSGLSGW
eukprot:CAMPEP_0113527044 /NCGR_PEP_ID=MMETSP0015_2-20120614/1080_1 /TAXON_ID=2838 /ORGANISM="Odontella" /LENGTH=482 /DNA_ID=CAMNT_0000425441 /DNA_START=182 /DNA_END=1628 /DNA_ORIENTATION=+ /assembly_acc=CAM_ASM_000160